MSWTVGKPWVALRLGLRVYEKSVPPSMALLGKIGWYGKDHKKLQCCGAD